MNILRRLVSLALILLVTFLVWCTVEGFCSTLLMASFYHPAPEEYKHSRHDPLLGWTNIPNLSVSDMYGPGVYFKTNARGFRNAQDVTETVPPGKIRIVCSGDSYTMGAGVDNDHAWCNLLQTKDPRIEAVNMGVAGYGMDQAYLRYMRDGAPIQHQIHLFSIISYDYMRFGNQSWGFDKPTLGLKNNTLTTENVPVPSHTYSLPVLTANIEEFRHLRVMELYYKYFPPKDASFPSGNNPYLLALTSKMLDELKRKNDEKNSTLVFVYLPTRHEPPWNDQMRGALKALTAQKGIIFLDLTDDFANLNPYDYYGAPSYAHFNNKGNALASDLIYRALGPIIERTSPKEP